MSKSKKKSNKPAVVKMARPQEVKPAVFGIEEMLSELEAIVAEAELRIRDEEAA
ncbi:hypothetical protein TUM12370_05350 [Salmonella enterica subsp. enterica serovar Choleraesuis]|nr:hypothetical protein TUM12370_05350 [Salmonella enterica subsp. enterica serovar Choleraesuis]